MGDDAGSVVHAEVTMARGWWMGEAIMPRLRRGTTGAEANALGDGRRGADRSKEEGRAGSGERAAGAGAGAGRMTSFCSGVHTGDSSFSSCSRFCLPPIVVTPYPYEECVLVDRVSGAFVGHVQSSLFQSSAELSNVRAGGASVVAIGSVVCGKS
jgi:hypothetical protein